MPRTPEQFQKIRERTKRQILNAGLKVFATKGYKGASIAEIAEEAGVSKGLAYNYFKSKKDLAEAVLLDIKTELTQFYEMSQYITDPYEFLKFSIQYTIKNVKENETFWRLYVSFITQIDVEDLAKNIFGEIADEYILKFIDVFKQIGVKDPKAEAYIFGALLDGVPLDYLFYKDKYPIEIVEKELLERYSKSTLDKLK